MVNTESVQGERNIIPQDEAKDFHEKSAESSSTNDDRNVYYEGDKEGLVYYTSYICLHGYGIDFNSAVLFYHLVFFSLISQYPYRTLEGSDVAYE